MANAFMTLDKWVYPAHEVDAEMAELRGQRDELLETLRVSEQALSAAVLGKTAFVGTALTEVRALIDKATSAQPSGANHG